MTILNVILATAVAAIVVFVWTIMTIERLMIWLKGDRKETITLDEVMIFINDLIELFFVK